MRARYKIYGLILLWSILCIACTDDELYRQSGTTQIVRVGNLELAISDIAEKKISLARVADQPALINSVNLFIFNAAGNREALLELYNADLQEYTDNSQNDRIYTVSKKLELTVGEKRCYAIANVENYSYLTTAVEEMKSITDEATLKAFLFSINPTTIQNQGLPTIYETETQILPFTGYGTLNVTETSNGNGTADGTVYLNRPLAHITFNITAPDENKSFVLSDYMVCNVAESYPVHSIDENVLEKEEDPREFYNTLPMQSYSEAGGTSTFDFYIPENVQPKVDGLTNYHDREQWNYATSTDAGKDWTNAPSNATYVIISGQYTESDGGKLVKSGNVSYTIHLGYFTQNDWSDFSIERNTRYTYDVAIMGVDKIIVEAKKEDGDYQHGAEGIIIDSELSEQIFDLDCHYEQAYVSYDLGAIAETVRQRFMNQDADEQLTVDKIIGNSFILKANTPFAPDADYIRPYYNEIVEKKAETAATAGMDYKWIYFLSQTNENVIAQYPGKQCESQLEYSTVYRGNKYLINPYELCVSLGELVKMIYENEYEYGTHNLSKEANDRNIIYNSDRTVRFTAFVDENYYQLNPLDNNNVVGWDAFTRQNDRSMLIASNIEVSDDGNSMYAQARTAFIQRSIQTFYNADNAYDTNAMGVETYCETGTMNSLGSGSWGDGWGNTIGISTTDGWTNMDELINGRSIGYTNNQWNSYVQMDKNGYLSSNTSLPDDHFIGKTSDTNFTDNLLVQSLPYYACLSRNRDLNGDGLISDEEVRWYLPASDQYLRLSIGADAMSERSRLFWGDKTNAKAETGRIYFTSTYKFLISDYDYSVDKQVLWAAEEGAFGQSKGEAGLVRCVRNLPKTQDVQSAYNAGILNSPDLVNSTANGGVSYILKRKGSYSSGYSYIFDFGDRLDPRISRTDIYTGPYPAHTEEGDANKLPMGFVVAKTDCSSVYGSGLLDVSSRKQSIWEGTYNPCSSYSEGTAEGAQGRWRVPNLREMMVMSSQAALLGFFNNSTTAGYYYMISTDFSGKSTGFTYLARYYYNGRLENRGFITTEQQGNLPIYVRCVRDMTEADNDASVVNP